MGKSILIIGPRGSGKTTFMEKYLSSNNTKFYKDEVTSCEKMVEVYNAALSAKSFCVIATQMELIEIPKQLVSKFKVVDLNK